MPKYILSVKAALDLEEIYIYTYHNFGQPKADAYFFGLEDCLSRLAKFPQTGRDISHIRKSYYRYEYMRHSIFYKLKQRNIIVVRVMHHSRDIEKHLN